MPPPMKRAADRNAPANPLTKPKRVIYNVVTKGRCYSSQTFTIVSIKLMTVSVPAGRSSRFYEATAQYNDRTDKKLEGFLIHLRHLLPAANRGKGKKV